MDAVVFTVIIDDLVFADGTTKMGVLGRSPFPKSRSLACFFRTAYVRLVSIDPRLRVIDYDDDDDDIS